MHETHKFQTLDVLRGVAAIAVVVFHCFDFVGFGPGILRHAYLAVDFFFMLSGFVLTSAYQNRLDSGWSSVAFLKVRLIRLYPLYFLGLLLGLTLRLIDPLFGKPSPSVGTLLTLTVAGLLVLPAPRQFIHISPFAFPFDVPAWSLFFEAIANLFHAFLLRRRSWIYLAAITTIAAGIFLRFVYGGGQMDIGSRRTEIIPGIARVIFSYTLGLLVFQVWQAKLIRRRLPPAFSAILLVALLAGPASAAYARGYDLAVTALCFPGLLLLSSSAERTTSPPKLLAELGITSYAIYILHVPILAVYFTGLQRLLPHKIHEHLLLWETVAFLPIIFCLSILADRLYDQPLRRHLRSFLAT